MVQKNARMPRIQWPGIRFDLSWIVILALITWFLTDGFFPSYYKGASQATYWIMGCAGSVGFVISIALHEIGHLLTARRFGFRVNGITHFVFGGVAERSDDPSDATNEFFIAAAGPLTSFCMAIVWFGLELLAGVAGLWALPYAAVFRYLGIVNFVLAGFNLIPAFPLDGGRVLLATLWQWKENLRWATEQTAKTGTTIGIIFMAWGIIALLSGSPVNGIWWLVFGQFLRNTAHVSCRAMAIRLHFKDVQVGRLMMMHPVMLASSTTLEQLVKHYFGKYRFKLFPVEAGRGARCVTMKAVKMVPRDKWRLYTIEKFAIPCPSRSTISIEDDIWKAYMLMIRTGNPALIVLDRNGKSTGMVALKDLMRFLIRKMYVEKGNISDGLERNGKGRRGKAG